MNLLKLENIKKSYNKGLSNEFLVLNGIDIEIKEKEFICLLGRSGSGKSTLVNIISGLLKPDSGKVILKGKNIINLSDIERTFIRRKEIGYVFQDYKLIPVINVEQNIKLPCIEKDEKYFNFIIKNLGLDDKLENYPDELSGGQQQRVAIARALINKPKLLLADEPTGNLDEDTANSIMEILKDCSHKMNKCVVIVTHSKDLAKQTDVILRLRRGELEIENRK